MNNFDVGKYWKMYGLTNTLDVPPSIVPLYPPGSNPPTFGLMDQNRLREKFFQNNSSINAKLEDFTKIYQKYARGLFESAHPPTEPGHPLFSRLDASLTLQNENDKLRKENSELRKQLEKRQKTNSQF